MENQGHRANAHDHASANGFSGITRGFSIGWCEGTGKKTKEFLEWNPGWAKPG
jgi:hypothetical protein